ncbi:CPBP family intramembrane glutamic endopeptidase [Rhodobacter lacus]|uniref:CPBP family intramembrane glutamic endopeptidase n=1 Tax=Rhodobacter lacus TaxID=1641972 RepID=A0ABW5A3M7_9RHOB
MTYPNLAPFVAPAAPRSEIWRSLIGLALIVAFYLGALFGGLGLVGLVAGKLELAVVMAAMARAGTPEGLSMVLATFAPLALGTLLVTRVLHRRPAASLLGQGAGRDFARVFPPLLGLTLLMVPFSFLDPHLGKSTPLLVLLTWLPLALPLLFVQIASEELLFRGYLLQQIAARWRHPALWMVLPAAIFGALHYSPGENGPSAIFLGLWAMGFGILAADLTARTGNLGPALAFHFANNLSAMFLVGLYGQLDGLSLYTLVVNSHDLGQMAPYLALDSVSMLVFWLAARLRLRR